MTRQIGPISVNLGLADLAEAVHSTAYDGNSPGNHARSFGPGPALLFFTGRIDKARICNKVLTPAENLERYNAGSTTKVLRWQILG